MQALEISKCNFLFGHRNIKLTKMKIYICMLLGLGLVITVQAKYEFTQKAKDCLAEINTNEETIRSLVTEEKLVPEDNELVQQFFGCIFDSFLDNNNELVVDEKLNNYIVDIVTPRMNVKRQLAKLMAKDCLEQCKDIKGATKGKAAVSAMNCIKTWLERYL